MSDRCGGCGCKLGEKKTFYSGSWAYEDWDHIIGSVDCLCNQLTAANEKIAELEARLSAANDEMQTLQVHLLFDDEKREIKRLMDEHGVVDEDLWSTLVSDLKGVTAKLTASESALSAAREEVERLRHESRNLLMILGWTPPESDDHDQFWFREDHGPVHWDDIGPFALAQVAGHEIAKATAALPPTQEQQ